MCIRDRISNEQSIQKKNSLSNSNDEKSFKDIVNTNEDKINPQEKKI